MIKISPVPPPRDLDDPKVVAELKRRLSQPLESRYVTKGVDPGEIDVRQGGTELRAEPSAPAHGWCRRGARRIASAIVDLIS